MTRQQLIDAAKADGWVAVEHGTETHLWRQGIGVGIRQNRTSYRIDRPAPMEQSYAKTLLGLKMFVAYTEAIRRWGPTAALQLGHCFLVDVGDVLGGIGPRMRRCPYHRTGCPSGRPMFVVGVKQFGTVHLIGSGSSWDEAFARAELREHQESERCVSTTCARCGSFNFRHQIETGLCPAGRSRWGKPHALFTVDSAFTAMHCEQCETLTAKYDAFAQPVSGSC